MGPNFFQLIGATTENPSFKLTGALLSRCRVFVLERLSDDEIREVIGRAVKRLDKARPSADTSSIPGSSQSEQSQSSSQSEAPPHPSSEDTASPAVAHLTPKIMTSLVSLAVGDARTALSLLELVLVAPEDSNEETLLSSLRHSVSTSYDRTGESHYDMISALHKSVRGSQGSAAMYWLARMLAGGEDPMYIVRRMIVCASEDIGLADNHALPLAIATMQACMPECRINLAHLVSYLSEAPKSTRAYEALARAEAAAKLDLTAPVPLQMRNAPTGLMKNLGYGRDYAYNPEYARSRHPVHNEYLPPRFKTEVFLREEGDMTGKLWDEDALIFERALYSKPTLNNIKLMNAPPSHHKMPVVQAAELDSAKLDDNAYRICEFRPFAHYEENPSWLAVRPLHNKVLTFEPPPDATETVAAGSDVQMRDVNEPEPAPKPRQIHITVCKVPVVYEAVLSTVPGFHSRPPVIPEHDEPLSPNLPPHEDGYDLCFH
ncbi:hypothetical protein HWV62_26112, partial [Athelia sp. TMB]